MNLRSLLSLLASVSICLAAPKPNFSGSWKMNAAKSDFGRMPVPAKLERIIKHSEPKMTVQSLTSSPQGDLTSVSTYSTDGKESLNTVRGTQVKSVVSWVGPTLVVQSTRQVQGTEITAVEHWSLSVDGKVLTVVNKISSPAGVVEATTVMDRQ